MMGKIMDTLAHFISIIRRYALGPAQCAHGPAICLPRNCGGEHRLMVESAICRILTQGVMGKCHFHDAVLA